MHFTRTFCAACSLGLSLAAGSAFALGAPPSPPRVAPPPPPPRPNVYVPPPSVSVTVPSGAVNSGVDAARGDTGGGVGQAGLAGRIAAAAGVTVSGAPGAGYSPPDIYRNEYDQQAFNIIADYGAASADTHAGPTTSVTPTATAAGPTTGVTPTVTPSPSPSPLPGPTANATPTNTWSVPPDPGAGMTQEQHQAAVDLVTNLQQQYDNLVQQSYNEKDFLFKVAGTAFNNLTPEEQDRATKNGGVAGLEAGLKATQAQIDVTSTQLQQARQAAQTGDSYRHVR